MSSRYDQPDPRPGEVDELGVTDCPHCHVADPVHDDARCNALTAFDPLALALVNVDTAADEFERAVQTATTVDEALFLHRHLLAATARWNRLDALALNRADTL